MSKEFEYSFDQNFDYTIDEKGNTFIALRKIDWGNKGDYKLDLRKYYASESGETMSKGLSFLTDDGPDELTKVLLETGYGNDDEIVDVILEKRPYIAAKIKKEVESRKDFDNIVAFESDDEDEFYDPEELMA